MKIQIISDIHLEFGIRDFDFSQAELLILAGDIHVGKKGLDWISDKVKDVPVIYVLGNHEYYKNSYPKLLHNIKKLAEGTNIHILENDFVVIEGIAFHGATLWTDFKLFGDPKIAGFECEQKMNDYQLIRRAPSYSKLRAIDTHAMHNESLKWLNESLNESATKTNVVVTHHAPSLNSISDRYKDDLVSAGFASNLDSFILEKQPEIWIHGHVHECFDYYIGKTRVVCNPTGYPGETSNHYKEHFILEISA